MDCKHCGNTIPDDSAFCQFCGKKLIDIEIEGLNSTFDNNTITTNSPAEAYETSSSEEISSSRDSVSSENSVNSQTQSKESIVPNSEKKNTDVNSDVVIFFVMLLVVLPSLIFGIYYLLSL